MDSWDIWSANELKFKHCFAIVFRFLMDDENLLCVETDYWDWTFLYLRLPCWIRVNEGPDLVWWLVGHWFVVSLWDNFLLMWSGLAFACDLGMFRLRWSWILRTQLCWKTGPLAQPSKDFAPLRKRWLMMISITTHSLNWGPNHLTILFLNPVSLETLMFAWPRNADLELPHLEFEIRISVTGTIGNLTKTLDALGSCSRKSMWR